MKTLRNALVAAGLVSAGAVGGYEAHPDTYPATVAVFDVVEFCEDPGTSVLFAPVLNPETTGDKYVITNGEEQVEWTRYEATGDALTAADHYFYRDGVQQPPENVSVRDAIECIKRKAVEVR